MEWIDRIILRTGDSPETVEKANEFCDKVAQNKQVYTLRVGHTVYQTTVREHYEAWLTENRRKLVIL